MFDKNVSELTSAEAAAELEHIAAEMAKSDIAYYQDDDPYLTDSQYDELKRRNQQIESRFPQLVRPDSPSHRVGAAVKSEFGKVPHRFPMLSLADVFEMEEVDDFFMSVKRFLNTAENIDFMAEPKIDGLSFSARYEKASSSREQPAATEPPAKTSPPTLKRFANCRLPSKAAFPTFWKFAAKSICPSQTFLPLIKNTKMKEKKPLPIRVTLLPVLCANWIRRLLPNAN